MHPSRLAVGRRILQSRATLVRPARIAASLNLGGRTLAQTRPTTLVESGRRAQAQTAIACAR
jgi:hypothetical protein